MSAPEIAKMLGEARRTGKTVPLANIADQETGFQVQRCYMEKPEILGLGKKVGWKLAPSRIEMVEQMKIPGPGRAPIFAANRFPSGATVPCGPKGTPANISVIEVECGFIMKDTLPKRATPYTEAEVWAAVEGMAPCFELVGSRWADMGKARGGDMTADCGMNWGVVVGPIVGKSALPSPLAAAPNTPEPELKQMKVDLIKNGEICVSGSADAGVKEKEGTGKDGPHGPFNSLFWLANHLATGDYGGVLEAGDVIIPGAAVLAAGKRGPGQGDHWIGRVDGLGTVEVTLGVGEPTSPLPQPNNPSAMPSSPDPRAKL